MASKRDLSLTPRKENQREAQPITPPVQFSLHEIKQHFVESMGSVKAQYEVADSLASEGNTDGCKTIWRSQVVADLFRRRNVIAHQNDRSHASDEQNDITKEFVSECISNIETIVNSIHEIAEAKG